MHWHSPAPAQRLQLCTSSAPACSWRPLATRCCWRVRLYLPPAAGARPTHLLPACLLACLPCLPDCSCGTRRSIAPPLAGSPASEGMRRGGAAGQVQLASIERWVAQRALQGTSLALPLRRWPLCNGKETAECTVAMPCPAPLTRPHAQRTAAPWPCRRQGVGSRYVAGRQQRDAWCRRRTGGRWRHGERHRWHWSVVGCCRLVLCPGAGSPAGTGGGGGCALHRTALPACPPASPAPKLAVLGVHLTQLHDEPFTAAGLPGLGGGLGGMGSMGDTG